MSLPHNDITSAQWLFNWNIYALAPRILLFATVEEAKELATLISMGDSAIMADSFEGLAVAVRGIREMAQRISLRLNLPVKEDAR